MHSLITAFFRRGSLFITAQSRNEVLFLMLYLPTCGNIIPHGKTNHLQSKRRIAIHSGHFQTKRTNNMKYWNTLSESLFDVEKVCLVFHYSDVMSAMASDGVNCLLNRVFRAQINENIKAPRHWPLYSEFPTQSPLTWKMLPFADAIMVFIFAGQVALSTRCAAYIV